MMSLWAAVELMRQQTWVSCQCHPEGDVSNNGCLSLIHCLVLYLYFVSSLTPCLSLTNHAFTLTHPHLLPPLNLWNISTQVFFLCLPYVFILSSRSLSFTSTIALNLSLFLPIFFLSLSSLVVVSLRGAVLLQTVCHREQREGEGKPVGDRRALLLTQVWVHCERFVHRLFHISIFISFLSDVWTACIEHPGINHVQ